MRIFPRNETLCYFWIQFQSCQVAHLSRRIVAFICDCITTATGKKLKLGWFTLRMLTMNRPPREDVGSCKFIKWSPGRCGIKQIAQFIWVFARRNGWGTLGNSPISSPGGSASLPLKTIWAMNRSSPTKKGGQIPSSGSGVESVCMNKTQSSWLLVLSYVSESLDLQNEPK